MIKILFSEKTMSWPYVCCPLTQGWSVRYIAQCSLFSYLNLLVLRPRCCAKHGLQNINLLCKLCKLWVQKLKEKCYVMLLINYELKYGSCGLLVVRMRYKFPLKESLNTKMLKGVNFDSTISHKQLYTLCKYFNNFSRFTLK